MTAPATQAPGTLLAGKYRLERVLGQGGMGAVWLAQNVDIGRSVAIKVLLPGLASEPSTLARFKQEARAAAQIGHPGIVDVLDLGTAEDGSPFIVMEKLEGVTLGGLLDARGRLDPAELVPAIAQALDALAAAHDQGIVHRDLKPDNLFLAERPLKMVKILDFGISKFRSDGKASATSSGQVMGTPLYMAPEQARSSKDVSTASDLYSVGAILYHALAGRPPYEGETYTEVIVKVMTQPVPSLAKVRPDLPPPLLSLVESLLAKEPAARPRSARAVRAMLLGEPIPPEPVRPAVDPALDSTAVRGIAPGVADTARPAASGIAGAVQWASGEAPPPAQQPTPLLARPAQPAPSAEELDSTSLREPQPALSPMPLLAEAPRPPPGPVPPPTGTVTPSAPAPAPAPAPPARRSKLPLALGLAAVLAAAGLGLTSLGSRPPLPPAALPPAPPVPVTPKATATATPEEPVAPPPPAPKSSVIALSAAPPEARWYLGQTPLCESSRCTWNAKVGETLDLEARAPGYTTEKVSLSVSGPAEALSLTLKPAPGKAARPRPADTKPARPPLPQPEPESDPKPRPPPPAPDKVDLDRIDPRNPFLKRDEKQ